MPDLTEWEKAFAIFMELYVEPLFIIPVAVYLVIAAVTNLVVAFIPVIQTLISAWG